MAAEQRVLLLSRAAHLSPVLRQVARERSLQLVRAADPTSAYEQLQNDRFACAILDLDALGEAAGEFVSRARGLQPGLRTLGFGGRTARPAAQRAGLPILPTPLTREALSRALDETEGDEGGARASAAPAAETPRAGDSSQEELRARISQLTTLYQIGRAISESRNWSEALDYFLLTLRDYLGVGGAAILLYSRGATVLAPRTVLAIPAAQVDACVRALLEHYPARSPVPEVHPLECWTAGAPRCTGHAAAWSLTVLPLLYRKAPLGFLVLDKPYAGAADFGSELFFLQTIQTILAEEVANAVHLSRLVDLKNFNEAVLDHVESGVLTATERGEITFLNRLAREILGVSPDRPAPPDLAFDAVFEVVGAVPCSSGFARLLAAGAREAPHVLAEVRRPDGRRVPVALRTSRTVNPSDSEPLVVVAFQDLTEQRLLEEQARRADRLRSLGELSAAIAHEVRNPLQGLSLTLSNLQEYLKSGAEPYVQVMFSEMDRLNSIVGGILSFARPATPMPLEVELGPLCARALELATERATQQGVVLSLERPAGDDRCEVDEGQILQVVLNLLLNAIDASPPGERVTMRIEPAAGPLAPAGQAAAGPTWRISVEDAGPGIPPDLLSKLFDPFFTTKSDGTGLGLAVSQKIVEEHRGAIHVRSRPGAGTTFVVELPRRFTGGPGAAGPMGGGSRACA